MRSALGVQAAGACTPLGLALVPTVAAERAGIRRFALVEAPGPRGDACTASRLSTIAPECTRRERVYALLQHAVEDCARQLTQRSRVMTLVCLPDGLQHVAHEAQAIMRSAVAARSHLDHAASGNVLFGARTIFLEAMAVARRALEQDRADEVLVGVADSLVDRETLAELARLGALQGERNLDGIFPGEAAACLSLALQRRRAMRTGVSGLLSSYACQVDAGSGTPADVSMSEALGRLFDEARSDSPDSAVDVAWSAQNGQSRWDRYFAYAYLRHAAWFRDPLRARSIAQAYGDLGCAALPLAAAVAMVPSLRAPRPGQGQTSLIHTLCDSGRGGSLLVEADA